MIGRDVRGSVSSDWIVMVTCVISEIMFVEGQHNTTICVIVLGDRRADETGWL